MAVEIKTIKIRRGLESELDVSRLLPGEFGFTTDTKRLFIGTGSGGKELSFKGEMIGEVPAEQIKEAVDAYLDAHPEIVAPIYMRSNGTYIQFSQDNVKWENVVALSDLKGPKGDNGASGSNGKSAYTYAKEGGYTGTEAEFTAALGNIGSGGSTDIDLSEYAKKATTLAGYGITDGATKTELETSVNNLKAQCLQQTPLFANSVSELNNSGDTSKVYVLPDGYIYGYMAETSKTYTDLVDTAVSPDSDEIYNGVGFKRNTYISSSSGYKESNGGTMATGLISLENAPNGVYSDLFVKGSMMTLENTETRITFFDSNKKYLQQRGLNNQGAYFEFEELGDNYFRIAATSAMSISSAAYVAITLVDNDNIPIVAFEEITDEVITTKKWKSTGHAFVPADYEDRIVVLENKKEDFEKRLSILENEQENGLSIPEYWIEHLEEKADDIRQSMENAGRNKSSFLWYHDSHWNYNSQKSPLLLSYLYQHTPINKTNFGGDIVNNEPTDLTDRATMEYLWQWRDMIRKLPNHHSVIGNHDDGNTTDKLFPESYIYAYLLAPEENDNVVLGDGFYYYIDNKSEKTRYLYLDTAYEKYTDISETQLSFVRDALKTTQDGWHVVAIAHIWHNTDYSVSPPVVAEICAAGIKLLNLFDQYNARNGDFSACGGKVEFCIGGHCHIDNDSRSDGGIPIILTETDSSHVRSGLGYTIGTITESSINAIIADYDNGIISVIRIGRGDSRTIQMVT